MFDRNDTKTIKGFAIVLMLMHHLWGFPERIAGGELFSFFSISGQSMMGYFGTFGKICVSIFFFLGGYGIYKGAEKHSFDILSKLKALYFSYWKVFLIFIPIAFLFFRNQPAYCEDPSIYARFSSINISSVLKDFIGVTNSLNGEWWFFISYVVSVCLFPILKSIVNRLGAAENIAFVIIISILTTSIFPSFYLELEKLSGNSLFRMVFTPVNAQLNACFLIGIVFAKEKLLIRLQDAWRNNHMNNPFSDCALVMVIVFLRNSVYGDTFDIFYVPFLIVAVKDLLGKISILRKLFFHIGCESTNMWLCHSFFCYYFYLFSKIISFPKWCVFSLILLIAISYAASVMVTAFWRQMSSLKNRVLKAN